MIDHEQHIQNILDIFMINEKGFVGYYSDFDEGYLSYGLIFKYNNEYMEHFVCVLDYTHKDGRPHYEREWIVGFKFFNEHEIV